MVYGFTPLCSFLFVFVFIWIIWFWASSVILGEVGTVTTLQPILKLDHQGYIGNLNDSISICVIMWKTSFLCLLSIVLFFWWFWRSQCWWWKRFVKRGVSQSLQLLQQSSNWTWFGQNPDFLYNSGRYKDICWDCNKVWVLEWMIYSFLQLWIK